MSIGIPTVETPIASEGINLENWCEILIANDSESFANMTKEAYENKKLWNDLSSKKLLLAERLFGLNSIPEKIKELLA